MDFNPDYGTWPPWIIPTVGGLLVWSKSKAHLKAIGWFIPCGLFLFFPFHAPIFGNLFIHGLISLRVLFPCQDRPFSGHPLYLTLVQNKALIPYKGSILYIGPLFGGPHRAFYGRKIKLNPNMPNF